MNSPKDNEYYMEIGMLVVGFSSLEYFLSVGIEKLINSAPLSSSPKYLSQIKSAFSHKEVASVITKNLFFKVKKNLFIDLFTLRLGEHEASQYKDFFAKLDEIELKRNHFIHSVWLINFPKYEKSHEVSTKIIDLKRALSNKRFSSYDFEKAVEDNFDIRELKQLYLDIVKAQQELLSIIESIKKQS